MATTSLTETIFLQNYSNPLTLTITVGFAQAGGSYVVFIASNGLRTELTPNAQGNYIVQPHPNSILSCVTTVQDINLATNNTSVTHDFNSATPNQCIHQLAVNHHNDKVVYDIQYIFS